jgi:hypothetical protein
MKKIFGVLTALSLSFCACACGNTSKEKEAYEIAANALEAQELEIEKLIDMRNKDDGYAYFGVHTHPFPLPIPGIDLGYRYKINSFAVDVGLKYTTAFVELDACGLKYIDNFYLGAGIRTSFALYKKVKFGDFGLMFLAGFEFKHIDRRPTFVQLEVLYPHYIYTHNIICLCQRFNIKYGWGF